MANATNNQSTLSTLTFLIKIFALAYVVLSLFQIGALGYETFKGPPEIVVTAGGAPPSMPIWPLLYGLASFISLLAILALIITSLIWIYRAHANLRDQNVKMDYSAAWAAGSYFVPVANLFVPYRAMRELHNRSHGAIPEHAHSGVEDVGAWWSAYISAILLWSGLVFKFLVDAFTNIVFLTPPWMEFVLVSFAQLLMIVACFMLIKLTRAITEAQAQGNSAWTAFE